MRSLVKVIIVVTLITMVSNAIAKPSENKARNGKARLEKSKIPFTDESFMQYFQLDDADVIQDFLDAGYDPNKRDSKHDPMLLIAAENDFLDVAKVLLEGGAYPDSGDWDGTTPLMYASYKQNTPMVKLFLKFNANINHQNRCGMTALMFAIKGGNGSTIDELLTKTIDLELKNDQGLTAKELALSLKFYYLADYMYDKVDFLNGRYVGKEKFTTVKLRDL